VEQTIEWQTPLYVTFVDFAKAFDSVDRQAIWCILKSYGVPEKIIDVIRELYEDFTCQVIHEGRMSDDFKVTTGVRQGCLLSPLLFLVVLDWVTRTAYADSGKGIQWTLMSKLEDLEFADDLALLAHRLQHMQEKMTALKEASQRVGLQISQEKTKVLQINTRQQEAIVIEDKVVEEVEEFVYLGSVISQTGGTEEDVRSRIRKAQQAFAVLRPVWKTTAISTHTKLRLFSSNVKSVLMYGSETWRTTQSCSKKIQTFVNKCLRRILHISWSDRVRNETLWSVANQQPMKIQINRRKWRWIGHTLRKETSNVTRQALEWNPQGKRKRGRPKQTWRRSLMQELAPVHLTWETIKRTSKDRKKWRTTVEALCSTRGGED